MGSKISPKTREIGLKFAATCLQHRAILLVETVMRISSANQSRLEHYAVQTSPINSKTLSINL